MSRTVSALSALSLGVLTVGTIVWAEAPPASLPAGPAVPPVVAKAQASATGSGEPASLDVLRGRPDSPQAGQTDKAGDSLVATEPIEFRAAGISIKPLANSRVLRQYGSDQIVEFVNDQRKWSLKISLVRTDKPMGLNQTLDLSSNPVPGIMDVSVERLKRDLPALKLLRRDTISIGDGGVPSEDPAQHIPNVGMLALRYTKGVERLLSQQAIIQSNENLYYLITLTSPGRNEPIAPVAPAAPNADPATKAEAAPAADPTGTEVVKDDGPADAGEKMAVETFEQVLDSVKLLDRSKLKEDQDQRLFKTRSLFVNLTEKRLRSAVVPQQWFRILRGGTDVGYVYSVEESADGIPQRDELHREELQREEQRGGTKAKVNTGETGVLVGTRSRMKSGNTQVDSESWMFVTMDRRHEDWSTITLVSDQKQKTRDNIMTLGTSDRQQSRTFDHEGLEMGYKGDKDDPNQPPVKMGEDYTLTVNRYAQKENSEPVTKRLPVFYLPQGLGYLLPRLVRLNVPTQYLFATYVADVGQVMLRYVDVGEEQHVVLAGRSIRAIPVQDKLGLDGAATTHFMSRDGQYLGSVTKETGITVVPTDEKTLREIWKDANLSRPADVEQASNAAVSRAAAAASAETAAGSAALTNPTQVGPASPVQVLPRRLAPRGPVTPKN